MTHPIKLTVDEPLPGQFVWTLLETEPDGGHPLILRSAGDPVDTYEAALASGQHAVNSEIRRRASAPARPSDAHRRRT
jgi:hypothetical protein